MGKLSKMQITLLHMFDAFHSLCEDNRLTYYALGGTMLGAVRHGGFIPWDDDIDVGMPRDDYNKIRKLMGDSTFEKVYVLETPESGDSNYCFPYSKFYDTSTTLIENSRQQLIRGVFIDVFPLEGTANTEAEAERRYKKIKNMTDLLTLRKLVVSSSRSSIKNSIIRMANIIPESILNTKRFSCDIDILCSKYPFNEYKLGGNLMGAWGIKEIMPR